MRLALSVVLVFLAHNLLAQLPHKIAEGQYEKLLYGPVYQFKYYGAQQHPFFMSDQPWKSTLIYKGHRHEHLQLLYDLHQQELVLFQERITSLPRYVCLNSKYVQEWRFTGENGKEYLFKALLPHRDILPENPILYRIYHDGHIKFVSSAEKEFQLEPYERESEMEQEKRYYLIKEQEIYEIRNRRTLLKAFKDDKDRLRKFIRKQNLTIRTSHVPDIIRLIHFYENNLSRIHETQ